MPCVRPMALSSRSRLINRRGMGAFALPGLLVHGSVCQGEESCQGGECTDGAPTV